MPVVYRNYLPEDFEKIKAMCGQFNINVPMDAMVYVAVEDGGEEEKLFGMIGIKGNIFIEPLIATNPLVGRTLFNKALDSLIMRGLKTVRCICNKDKAKVFEKAGFKQIESDKIIMEKELNNG